MNAFDRIKPFVSRIRPRLGLSNEFTASADRSWELSPEISATLPPAQFDPEDLQKITATTEETTVEVQLHKARGGPGRHRATRAYEIRNAVLHEGNVFSRKVALHVSARKSSLFARADYPHFNERSLVSSAYGIRYFGHWLTDDLPRTLAARELAPPVSVLTHPTVSQASYLRALDLDTEVAWNGFFDRLIVIDDVGQNRFKCERYNALHRLGAKYATGRRVAGVMLLRGASGARRMLTNESEVASFARSRGMTVIDPFGMPAEDIIRACYDAELVLGVEGSHLPNAVLWMSRIGTLVTIQPPQRFNMVLKDTCDCIGINTAFIVADAVNATDFCVDLRALGKLLDRVANQS